MDATFRDILKNLDVGLMGAAEARYGNFLFIGDAIYVKLSASEKFKTRFSARANLDTTNFVGTAAVGYRIVADPTYTVDVIAAVRDYDVSTDVALHLGKRIAIRKSTDENWLDPMVGGRVGFNLSDRWFLAGTALVGGFGMSSDFSWDVIGTIGYRFTENVQALAGYRALGVDYHNDGFKYDIVQHGPFVGFRYKF
ncbi:hypothetical protein [Prosthecomicrobium sp. N25]|uniref:hypothetical protein n=1 Tax=Prosthecomicrobium sp. N25 TaxID=3129254 RepID=UPI0030783DAB